jgi:Zn-dependent peptidase ImmA (M78 family)/DNA-binding XRE family transcriptional regulator
MLTNINPEMLLLARESRGIAQSELALAIGISQGKLSKAEKGEQSLPTDIFNLLCKYLRYPVTFFYQTSPSSQVSHYYYRKKITIPQKVIVQMEAVIRIFRRNIDTLIEAVELPEFKLVHIPSPCENPESLGQMARYILGLPKGPIQNLVNTLENSGIIIVKTDLFHEKIDGLSTISEKGANIIFLNSRMPNDRQRFSLAHELGHLLMHFEIPKTEDNIEDEANRFASEFLMPKSEIINSLRFLNFSKLGELKRYWKVSMKALVQRAKFLGLIDQNQYRNFQINFSKRDMNKSEPIPLDEEKPFILNEIIKLHIEELGYSKEDLANILYLCEEDYKERFDFINRTRLKVLRNSG